MLIMAWQVEWAAIQWMEYQTYLNLTGEFSKVADLELNKTSIYLRETLRPVMSLPTINETLLTGPLMAL